MAIQAKATRKGIQLAAAYILVNSVKMDKYLRPTLDENNKFAGNVVSVQYSARAEIYSSKAEREEDFGGTPFNTFFAFAHTPGADLIEEAYAYIVANGIAGWVLDNMVEV